MNVNLLFLFPFLSLGLLNLDMQPFGFLAAVFIFFKYSRIERQLAPLLLPIIGLWVTVALSDVSEIALIIRATIFYCTPIVVAHVVFFSLKYGAPLAAADDGDEGLPHARFVRLVKGAVWCNFIVALIQIVVSRDLFAWLVTVRTSPERGVTGLTPEPSMYGLSLLALGVLVFCLRMDGNVKKRYLLLLTVQLIVFSQSTLAIASFVLMLVVYLALHRMRFLIIGVGGISLVVSAIGSIALPADSNLRLLSVLGQLLSDPSNILYIDGSISERFYHFVLPAYGYGLPQGLSTFSALIVEAQQTFPSFWWGDPTDKIMSGVGGAFWELGLFALPLYLLPFRLASRSLGLRSGLFVGTALLLIFMHSVTYGLPLYAMVCGYLAFLNDGRQREGASATHKDSLTSFDRHLSAT